jgi:tetratricopeptide (TPR) repeat protein
VSRRRRGIYGQTMHYLSTAFAAVGWWLRAVVMYPVYVVGDAWNSLFGGGGNRTSRGSMGTQALDAVLTVPSLIWHYTYVGLRTVGGAAQNWPSMMRLRDLAAGLPALLVMSMLGLGFFFLPGALQSKQEVINSYQAAYQETADAANGENDPKELKILHEKMLLYLRALSQTNPDDELYRFGIARVYYLLGDVNRGQAMMERLAPRSDTESGFVPAHLWLAQLMFEAGLYDDALAHLNYALSKDDSGGREIHWQMAQVYFNMYKSYRPELLNPPGAAQSEAAFQGFAARPLRKGAAPGPARQPASPNDARPSPRLAGTHGRGGSRYRLGRRQLPAGAEKQAERR